MAQRPRFLNLARIHFPLSAVVSIAHRISGVALFACLPFVLWSLDTSLHSEVAYRRIAAWASSPVASVFLALTLLAFVFHVAAGIRVILFDAHWLKFRHAKTTALWTLAISVAATAAAVVWLGTSS